MDPVASGGVLLNWSGLRFGEAKRLATHILRKHLRKCQWRPSQTLTSPQST